MSTLHDIPDGPVEELDAAALEDLIGVLQRHQIECEKTSRYSEAEATRKRLEQLRETEKGRAREVTRSALLSPQ